MCTDVRTVPPAEDVEHVGDVPVRRRWVQYARRPVSMIWSIQMPAGNKATDKCPPACGHSKDRPAEEISSCRTFERGRRVCVCVRQ